MGWMSDNDLRFVISVASSLLELIFIIAGRIDFSAYASEIPRTLLILTWCWKEGRRWLYFQVFLQLLYTVSFPLHSFELAIFALLCLQFKSSFTKPSLEYILKSMHTVAMEIGKAENRSAAFSSSYLAFRSFCNFS